MKGRMMKMRTMRMRVKSKRMTRRKKRKLRQLIKQSDVNIKKNGRTDCSQSEDPSDLNSQLRLA